MRGHCSSHYAPPPIPSRVQALERVFRICDRDVDGVLSVDEYGHLLRKGDPIHLPEHHIEHLFQVRTRACVCAGEGCDARH